MTTATAAQQRFDDAVALWEQLVIGDLVDTPVIADPGLSGSPIAR